MAKADALRQGERITKFCCECRHFIPSHRHSPEPKCKKFRSFPDSTYGHRKPGKCSELRRNHRGAVLCGPRAKGWEAKPIPWWKCLDFWNWPPPEGGPDPLRDSDGNLHVEKD